MRAYANEQQWNRHNVWSKAMLNVVVGGLFVVLMVGIMVAIVVQLNDDRPPDDGMAA